MTDDNVISLREQIARDSIKQIQTLAQHGQQPTPWLAVETAVELLLDIFFDTDDERDTFLTQVEKRINEKLTAAVEAVNRPKLVVPETQVPPDLSPLA